MRQYRERWQLKNLAKDKMAGKYSEAVLLTLIYGLFLIADTVITTVLMYSFSDDGNLLMNMLLSKITPTGYIASLSVSLLTSILIGALGAGVSLYYLTLACGQPASIRNLFHAYKENPNKYLTIALVQTLIHFVCSLPAYLCNYFNLINPSYQWTLLFYICEIVGQLVAYPLVLGLSQSYRLLLDFPEMSVIQVLLKSWRLMKGSKLRLFLLILSFLPLELAAVFTCGIGYLWLSPYKNMTYTLFYLELLEKE